MDELFSERLTELIKHSNYILNDMEEAVGKKAATISRYASGEIKGVKRSTIVKLADFFGVSPAWLSGLSNEKYIINKQSFPILGLVKAGYDYLASENMIGAISIDEPLSDPENYYALKIKGNSMEPILYEDDIVIVHKQHDVESGQIAIILIDDEEATIKRVIKTETGIKLEAFNPYYPPREFTFEDMKKNPVEIIGRVEMGRIKKIFN